MIQRRGIFRTKLSRYNILDTYFDMNRNTNLPSS